MKLNLWGRNGGEWEHIDTVERAGDKATSLADSRMAPALISRRVGAPTAAASLTSHPRTWMN